MEPRWQMQARAVGTTFLLTTLFWFGVGGWLYMRQTGSHIPAPASLAAPPANAQDGPDWRIPVAGVRFDQLTDTFSQSREDGARRHDALDIMAPRGTLVTAAAPGTVEKLFTSADGGNTIYIRSADRRTITYYAHLDSYVPGLAEGQRVNAGAPLGRVGTTGNASPDAPHLHFAVWHTAPERQWYEQASPVNPYDLLRPGTAR